MFDISFGEILVIVVVAVLLIGPKDLPVVIRSVARGIGQMKRFVHDIKEAFSEVAEASGITDLEAELDKQMTLIRGDDGKLYPAYDIDDFVDGSESVALPKSEAADD